ncbi:MAG: hypothetical protein SO064_03005 [Prevotella sp.]|nr:hypothetical protein [Prevotella sp.]
MKKMFTNLCKSLCVAALAGMAFVPIPACAQSSSPGVYKITFGGRGESKTVDRVLVENLSKGCSVELSGKETLLLTSSSTGIEEMLGDNGGKVTIENGKLLMSLLYPTDVQVNVYTLNGTLAMQTRLAASSCEVSMPLPPLRKGVYVVRATAPGLNKSMKWLCNGSSSLSAPAFTTSHEAADEQSEQETLCSTSPSLLDSDNEQMEGVELQYEKGDLLRFTGFSGDMTTIITNSPRGSHPIYFDFFKCQDADGHNYAIVRAGDMLWMAEDLRSVNSLNINDAGSMSSEAMGNPDMAIMAKADGKAYYSKAAAIKALPEGWKLPSLGEIDYVINKLNGGDYTTAGAYFKGYGEGCIDSTSIRMTAGGRYNGSVVDADKGYFMTRSTKGGIMLAMQLSNSGDGVSIETCQNYLIAVRGVRTAPSVYTEMMESFGYTNQNPGHTENLPASLLERGPLGKTYIMHTAPQSIAYDFTGGQFGVSDAEARSGVLTKDSEGNWTIGERRDADFLSDCKPNFVDDNSNKSKLRKMAVMNNGNGTQYIIEMQWDKPFRVVTQQFGNEDASGKVNFSYQRTDTPDVFGNSCVSLTIAGDALDGHEVLNEKRDECQYGFSLSRLYDFTALPQSILPYFRYHNDNRATETRIDYVQRCFQLLTADFNDDGVDEIIVAVDGQVDIYDGAVILNDIKNLENSECWEYHNYKKPSLYYKNFKLQDDGVTEFDCSAYYLKKPMVRFAIGDVNADGISDLVVLRVGTGGEEGKAKAELMVYSAGDVTAEPIAYSCFDENYTKAVFNDIKIGNVSGSKYNDIIMLFRNYSGTALAKTGYMWHAMYDPSNTETHLKIDSDNVGENGSFAGYDGHIGNTNITLANFRGPGYPCDIVCGADLWRWNSETEKIEFCDFQVLPFTCNDIWSIFADNIIAADVDGEGYDKLYYFRNWNTNENGNRLMFQGLSETSFNSTTDISASTLKHYHNFNSDLLKYCDTGKVWNNGDQKQDELMWWFGSGDCEWGNNSAICAVYDRPGHKVLQYKGHELAFTEPRIYALIAAPPTYDYGNETEPGYDSSTSWGYSRSTSQQTTNSSSVKSSLIVGFEQEFNAPLVGTKLGGVEFTTKMEQECSKSTSKTSTTSYSQRFNAEDDDRVVMQTTPYDNFTYEVVASDNVDEIGGILSLSIPQKPATIGLALTDYERYVGSDKNSPDLRLVFKHTLGDPFSYPSTADQIVSNVPGSVTLWGNGRWNDFVTTGSGGSTEREIGLDNSTATSAAFTFSVESELVMTVGCAKAGAGFGYGNTNETTHEESQGFTVSACVPGLAPGDTNSNRKFFDWNLCWYKYKLCGQTFPVINYVVKKR